MSGTLPLPHGDLPRSRKQLDDRYFRGLNGKYDFDLHFILQEKDATAGEYIVRARGAWFGNRSISAEVDLEVGTYEVLPKIEASRDADIPDVHEVVTKVAERNPQKLRQIGLNYDIANAKGVSEETEDERRKSEKKRKEDAEEKRKSKKAEEKEKEEFELWKKDERAEYESWKRDKKTRSGREELRRSAASEQSEQGLVEAEEAKKTDAVEQASETASGSSESKHDQPTADMKYPHDPANLSIRPKDSEVVLEPQVGPYGTDLPIYPASDNIDEEVHGFRAQPHPLPSAIPSISAQHTNHELGYQQIQHGDEPEHLASKPQTPHLAVSEEPKTWNAVCVLGLRVYSQDSEVSIKLIKPRDVEEGAILDVDGDTAAGATM